jgi:hypothetical protein
LMPVPKTGVYEKECKTFIPKACHFSKASGTSSKTSPSNSLFSNPVCHI